MEKNILNAFERNNGNKRFREDGFVAGVIYGDGVKETTSVKFEEVPLRKILAKHGANAKIWVKLGEDKKFGFIKEIQRHPVTAKIIHMDVQLVSKNHEIKLQLPITFKGEESLNIKLLQLQICKSEIDVFGRMDLMPDGINIDVSGKELGDVITAKDFVLDNGIKINDKQDEVYATVTHLKVQAVAAEEGTAETETEAKAE